MAESVVSRILVELGANVEGFKRGFDQAISKLGGFGNAVRGFQERAGHLAFDKLTAAASALPSALAAAVTRTLNAGDALQNLTVSSGQSVETLERLRIEGSLVGVALEQSLGAHNVLLKGINTGGKDAAEAMHKLGLSAGQLRSMGADEALAKVGEKLSSLPTHADRAAAASALLGKNWQAVMPLLAGGMDNVKQKAEELGVSYEALSGSMSGDTAAAAGKLKGDLDILGMASQGLVNRFGATVATSQAVHDAVAGVTRIVAQLSQAFATNQDTVQDLIQNGLWLFLELVAGGGAVVTGFLQILLTFGEAFTFLVEGPNRAAAAVANFLAMAAQKAGMTETAAALRQQAVEFQGYADKAATMGSKAAVGLEKARDASAGLTLRIHDLANNLGSGNVKLDESAKKSKGAADGFKLTSDAAKQATEVLNAFNDKLNAARAKDQGPLAAAMAGVDQEVDNAIKKLKEMADAGQLDAQAFQEMSLWLQRGGAELKKFVAEDVRLQRFGKTVHDSAKELEIMSGEATLLGVDVTALTNDALEALVAKLEDLAPAAQNGAEGLKLLAAAQAELNDRNLSKQKEDSHKQNVENLNTLADLERAHNAELIAANQLIVGEIRNMAGAFDEVGQAMGGTTGAVISFGAGAMQVFANLIDLNIKYASTFDKIAMAAGAAAQIISASKEERSGGKRAASGAMTGAQAGAAFGPYGIVIGAVAGALIGFFSGPAWAGTAKTAGQVFGFEVSNELAKKIHDTKFKFGIDAKSASLLLINEAMAEGKKKASEMTGQMQELLAGIASGAIPAREGTEALGEAFASLADEVMATSDVGSAAMVSLIRNARAAGVEVAEISAHVREQLARAQEGVSAMVASYSEDKGEGSGFISGIQLNTEQQAQDQGVIFAAVFWASVREQGIVAAADAMRETFARLTESMDMLGEGMGEAILSDIQAVMELTAEGTPFRGAIEGAEGLREALGGLAASGYLTENSFAAIQRQAQAAFSQATSGGVEHTNEALLAMGPLLQDIVRASQEYGLELDSNTQDLIRQAEAAGVAFPVDPMVQMVDLLRIIAVQLGAEIPAAASAAGSALSGELNTGAQEGAAGVQGAADAAAGALTGILPPAADEAGAAVEGSLVAMADGLTASMETTTDEVASLFDAMVVDAMTGAGEVAGIISDLDSMEINIPVRYTEEGDRPGGGGGPNGDPSGLHASGHDAIARTDGYLKYHRGEHVAVMPPGSSPLSRGIAGDVAAALAGSGGNNGGGGTSVRQPIVLQLFGQRVGEVIFEMSKTGEVRIHESAVVS